MFKWMKSISRDLIEYGGPPPEHSDGLAQTLSTDFTETRIFPPPDLGNDPRQDAWKMVVFLAQMTPVWKKQAEAFEARIAALEEKVKKSEFSS